MNARASARLILDIDSAEMFIELRYMRQYRYALANLFMPTVLWYGRAARTSDLFRELDLVLHKK